MPFSLCAMLLRLEHSSLYIRESSSLFLKRRIDANPLSTVRLKGRLWKRLPRFSAIMSPLRSMSALPAMDQQ